MGEMEAPEELPRRGLVMRRLLMSENGDGLAVREAGGCGVGMEWMMCCVKVLWFTAAPGASWLDRRVIATPT